MNKIHHFLSDPDVEIEMRINLKHRNKNINHVPKTVFETIKSAVSDNKTKASEHEMTVVCSDSGYRKIIHLKDSGKTVDHVKYENKKRLIKIPVDKHNLSISAAKETPADEASINNALKKKLEICRRFKDRESIYVGDWRFDFTGVIELSSNANIESWKSIIKGGAEPVKYEIEAEYVGGRDVSLSAFEKSALSAAALLDSHLKKVVLTNNNVEKRFFYDDDNRDIWKMRNNVTSLSKSHLSEIQEGYSVTEKADGERHLLLIDGSCNAYLINGKEKVSFDAKYANGNTNRNTNALCNSVLDGELVNDVFYTFDILFTGGTDVRHKNLQERYKLLNQYDNKKTVKTKKFYFFEADFKNIYEISADVYQPKKYPYELDGLIYTPINKPYNNREIYKWKPPSMVTIDFLVKKVGPGKYNLYSGINIGAFFKAKQQSRLEFYDKRLFPWLSSNAGKKPKYIPVHFTPDGDKSVGTIVIPSNNTNKINVFDKLDDKIAELAYLDGKWSFHRLRDDKTVEYEKAKTEGRFAGPNDWTLGSYPNWQIIKDPITEAMITGKEEVDLGYYTGINRDKAKQIAPNMHKVHNYMKEALYAKIPVKKRILELAGGRGGDMYKYFKFNETPEYVFFTNLEQAGINEAKKKFELEGKKSGTKQSIAIDFLNANLTKNQVSRISKKSKHQKFDLVSCQFAMHYFMESEETFTNFFNVVDTFLEKGGYFMATTFDGETVFDLLKKGGDYSRTIDETRVFNITKCYKNRTLKDFGQKILVDWLTIGEHPEYLVNYIFLIKFFEENGYELVESAMFSELFDKIAVNKKVTMNEAEKAYSFLNRYIIFRKQ